MFNYDDDDFENYDDDFEEDDEDDDDEAEEKEDNDDEDGEDESQEDEEVVLPGRLETEKKLDSGHYDLRPMTTGREAAARLAADRQLSEVKKAMAEENRLRVRVGEKESDHCSTV
jgi:hypothetical protein